MHLSLVDVEGKDKDLVSEANASIKEVIVIEKKHSGIE